MDSNSLRPISKIFNQAIYRIPDYQRGYAWTTKQVQDFISDIVQLENGKSHYVGVVTLEATTKASFKNWDEDLWIIQDKNFLPYYVVDGQQRLTTTVILIESICEVAKEKNIESLNYTTLNEIRKQYIYDSPDSGISRSYIFGYEKDNPSYEFLKIKIFGESSPSGYNNEETIYTNNLQNAKDTFIEYLKDLEKVDIEDIYRKTTQNLLFNTYAIESEIDVFVAFETMNNRGIRLSNLELLKNRLIYLSTRYASLSDRDRESLRKTINDSWKSIYHYLGKNKERPLKDDVFLYVHTQMYFGQANLRQKFQDLRLMHRFSRSYGIAEEVGTFLLEDEFSVKSSIKDKTAKKRRIPAKDVKSYAENISRSVIVWFDLNNPIKSSNFNEKEKIWADKVRRNETAMNTFAPTLLEFYLLEPTKIESVTMLKVIERIGFLLNLSHNYEVRRIVREMLSVPKKVSNAQQLIEFIEKMNEKIIELGKDESYGLQRLESRGYYVWDGLRYFLYEYELDLEDRTKSTKHKIDWDEYSNEAIGYSTVEHIYPQTPTDEYWESRFGQYSSREKRRIRDSLGNLLPLSKPRNSSIQNASFIKKCDNESKICYKYGSLSEIEVTSNREWTLETVINRGLKLLDFMERRWNIELGDRNQKIELLGLHHVNTDTKELPQIDLIK